MTLSSLREIFLKFGYGQEVGLNQTREDFIFRNLLQVAEVPERRLLYMAAHARFFPGFLPGNLMQFLFSHRPTLRDYPTPAVAARDQEDFDLVATFKNPPVADRGTLSFNLILREIRNEREGCERSGLRRFTRHQTPLAFTRVSQKTVR
ncbi:hypothetical protein AGR4C_pc30077 [Agrobacterium tumefaciens str. Kerr 14]|uniref:Uncharacterized protein n=1 Tax=Agrobacterium tumefaciens str. Kerr 14 TaxID=1183424 RepID=A0A1S7SGU3_AGRTU|nr:hypothetical protein AGR4C_pc30077 [Agrobacterium tumefaciens str. Kerr 14]